MVHGERFDLMKPHLHNVLGEQLDSLTRLPRATPTSYLHNVHGERFDLTPGSRAARRARAPRRRRRRCCSLVAAPPRPPRLPRPGSPNPLRVRRGWKAHALPRSHQTSIAGRALGRGWLEGSGGSGEATVSRARSPAPGSPTPSVRGEALALPADDDDERRQATSVQRPRVLRLASLASPFQGPRVLHP